MPDLTNVVDAWEGFKVALLLFLCYIVTKSNPVADAVLHLVVAKLEALRDDLKTDLASKESVEALRIEVAQIRETQMHGRSRSTDKLPQSESELPEGGM